MSATTPVGGTATSGILGKIFGGAGGQDSLLNSLLVSGLGAGAGAFNNTPTTTTENSTTTPNLDPTTLSLRNKLVQGSQSLLGQDPDLRGYTAQGLGNINSASNAQNKVLNQTLAARGLQYSPLASAEQANLGNEQFKQSTDFLNQVPLLKNQLLQQRLANVTNTFRSLPYGQNYSGKRVVSGHMIGGALTGLLASLLSKKPKSPGGIGGIGGGGGGGAPTLQQILQQLPNLPYGGLPGGLQPGLGDISYNPDPSQSPGLNETISQLLGSPDYTSIGNDGLPSYQSPYNPTLGNIDYGGGNPDYATGGSGGFGGGFGDFGGSPEEIF